MHSEELTIQKGGDITRAVAMLSAFVRDGRTKLVISEARNRRSDQQNRYLWGCVYPKILQHLQGWDAEDVHEFCLGEWSGWERLDGLGRPRLKPRKRSSKLNTVEFMDFVAHIQRTMADRGIDIPDPNEELTNEPA